MKKKFREQKVTLGKPNNERHCNAKLCTEVWTLPKNGVNDLYLFLPYLEFCIYIIVLLYRVRKNQQTGQNEKALLLHYTVAFQFGSQLFEPEKIVKKVILKKI